MLAPGQYIGQAPEDLLGAGEHDGAHGIGQIGHLRRQLDDQAVVGGLLPLLGFNPAGKIELQALGPTPIGSLEQCIQPRQILGKLGLQQSLTKPLFGGEIVIERALGHSSGGQQLGQPDADEALAGDQTMATIENVLTGIDAFCSHVRHHKQN